MLRRPSNPLQSPNRIISRLPTFQLFSQLSPYPHTPRLAITGWEASGLPLGSSADANFVPETPQPDGGWPSPNPPEGKAALWRRPCHPKRMRISQGVAQPLTLRIIYQPYPTCARSAFVFTHTPIHIPLFIKTSNNVAV